MLQTRRTRPSTVALWFSLLLATLSIATPRSAAASPFVADPELFTIYIPFGENPPLESFALTNPDGVLRSYTVEPNNPGAVEVSPTGGSISSETDVITITISAAGAPSGRYYEYINVHEVPQAADPLVVGMDIVVYDPGAPQGSIVSIYGPILGALDGGAQAARGATIALDSFPGGTPPFGFQWEFSRDGINWDPVVDNEFIVGSQSTFLYFLELQYSHTGIYRQFSYSDLGDTVSEEFYLEVAGTPDIVEPPVPAVVGPGGNAIFSVVADGLAPLGYQWEFASASGGFSPIGTAQPGIFGTNTDTLQIFGVEPAHEGDYRCVITSGPDRAITVPVSLTIAEAPVIFLQPADTTVELGQTIAMDVAASGTGPFDYAWYFSTDDAFYDPLTDDTRISGANDAHLRIANATVGDEGYYQCFVSNAAGLDVSRTAFARVNFGPFITQQPQSSFVFLGDEGGLNVRATGTGTLHYQWEVARGTGARGVFQPVVDDGRIVGAQTDSLRFQPASFDDIGYYQCVVTDDQASRTSRYAFFFVGEYPAQMRIQETQFDLACVEGTSPPAFNIVIENLGQEELSFELFPPDSAVSYDFTPSIGTVPGGTSRTVSVQADTASFSRDVIDDVLRVVGSDGQEIDIAVHIEIGEAFDVTTLADSGLGSLRNRIEMTNAASGKQTINFLVSGTIKLLTPLPHLTDTTGGTTIDGGNRVALSGENLTAGDGIVIESEDNEILNLTIINFPGNGIALYGAGAAKNRILGNTIGLLDDEPAGNKRSGILIEDGPADNVIGGDSSGHQNVIAGNSWSAITLIAADGNKIRANFFGRNLAGTRTYGNGGNGVHILPSPSLDNDIGGIGLFDRNDNAGQRFYTASVEVLIGGTVELKSLADGEGTLGFRWVKEETGAVASTGDVLSITNAQPSDTGVYYCVISNGNGETVSEFVHIKVVTRVEAVAYLLYSQYATIDTNLDGGLTIGEASGPGTRALKRASPKAPGLSTEDFEAMDTDNDGILTAEEVLIATGLDPLFSRYGLFPEFVPFDPRDIDDGIGDDRQIVVVGLDTNPTDVPTTPTARGIFSIVSDTGEGTLPPGDVRTLTLNFDPSVLGTQWGYVTVQTDDFLLPTRPVVINGLGYQTTAELLASLLDAGTAGKPIGEFDVNADAVFDESDISSNVIQGF